MDDDYLAPTVKDPHYHSRPIEDDIEGPKGKGRCCLKKVVGCSHREGQDGVGSSCSRQDQKVFLSVKELLALLPEVRKYFKEATTTKCHLSLPAAGAHTVSTFFVGVNHDILKAAPTLPLRTLNINLNGSTLITGILDSGCQVVIIHRDI